ncbi:MAG: hypothetical protein ACMXYF_02945 [Candidatus Woesearchaeota archaeon]
MTLQKQIFKFCKKDWSFLVLFFLSTIYFLYEQITNISWDFVVYLLNAQFYFDQSLYFEIGRPPLASFLMGLFGVLTTWEFAQILFIIFVCILYAYSVYLFSLVTRFHLTLTYAFFLNAYVIIHGLFIGTEMLSLAFLLIAIAGITGGKMISGVALGLSALSRYTGLALFPLLLFHFQMKKIIFACIGFGLTLGAWLIYNYFVFGHMFASITNQYALNVLARREITQPVVFSHFFEASHVLTPFVFIGVIVVFVILFSSGKKLVNKKITWKKAYVFLLKYQMQLLMIFLGAYTIYSYATTPFKFSRYLFFLTVGVVYFGYIGFEFLAKKVKFQKKWWTVFAILFFSLNMVYVLLEHQHYDSKQLYEHSISVLEQLNLTHCQIHSNAWPYLNYLGQGSAPFLHKDDFSFQMNQEQTPIHVLFPNSGEPDYVNDAQFMQTLPILYNDSRVYVVGTSNCIEFTPYRQTYLEEIKARVQINQNVTININPCFILFNKYGLIESGCNFLHGEGWQIDDNRGIWW